MATYYHNPRCSKSRQGLEILNKAGFKFDIKEYLKEEMTIDELKALFKKLDKSPLEVMRTKEKVVKELGLNLKEMSDDDLMALILKNPILLERPILVTEKAAAIGRPPENFIEFIKYLALFQRWE